MEESYKVIVKRLNEKKEKLKDAEYQFAVQCSNEMQGTYFTRNAIHELIVMGELKAEIAELEFCECLLRNNQ